MVEVYSTDIKTEEMANRVLLHLLTKFPHYKINFDLEDCDKILRVESDTPSLAVEELTLILKNMNVTANVLSETSNTEKNFR
jgi:hypothetical protein